jgi:hypothetical protein
MRHCLRQSREITGVNLQAKLGHYRLFTTMAPRRKSIAIDVKQQVLHESGFQCANPACRRPLTLDIHHLEKVADGGSNEPHNLIALCPNCHADHHRNIIPQESVRAWKMLLVSLNEGIGRRSMDVLLTLNKVPSLMVSGEGALLCAPLIAANLVCISSNPHRGGPWASQVGLPTYLLELTEKGRQVTEAWLRGDQVGVVNA